MLKLDLHIHTIYSKVLNLLDSSITFEDIISQAREKKLNGVAITDHNSLKGAMKFKKYVRRKDIKLLVIPGEEIKTREGDVLALGVEREIKPGLDLDETLDLIKKYGGISIAAHPYLRGMGEGNVRRYKFDGIEVYNSNLPLKHNLKAYSLSEELGLSKTAGSDAHFPKYIGAAFTLVESDLDADSVIEAIRKGKTRVFGKNTTPLGALVKEVERAFFKLRSFI